MTLQEQDLFHVFADWEWSADRDLCLTQFDMDACAAWGIPASDLLGRSLLGIGEIGQVTIGEKWWMSPFRDVAMTVRRGSNDIVHFSLFGVPVFDDDGAFIGVRGATRNISESFAANCRLGRLARSFDQSPSMIVIVDEEGIVEEVNPAAIVLSGYEEAEIKQLPIRESLLSAYDSGSFDNMVRTIKAGEPWFDEARIVRNDGSAFWCEISASPIVDPVTGRDGMMLMFTDVSARKAAEGRLQRRSRYDEVTGLPNRILAEERLARDIERCAHRSSRMAVVAIDLDHFQVINAMVGREGGNGLLCDAGFRLHEAIKAGDTLARMDGDEFLLIVPECGGRREVDRMVAGLNGVLANPFDLGNEKMPLGACMGIALYPDDGNDGTTLICAAEAALHAAKRDGRGKRRFFEAGMDTGAMRRASIEAALHGALANNELSLVYQPVVDVGKDGSIGAEVLLRWKSPAFGNVSPEVFVPIAEETGLIVPIGEWVLDGACRQMAEWRKNGHDVSRIAINVSGEQLRVPGFAERVMGIIVHHGLESSDIDLEITESLFIDNDHHVIDALNRLKESGVRLSIDDFGTGFSSLGYLPRLPAGCVKIDRSFVRGIGKDDIATAVIKGIIGLVKSLKMDIIGEGVETVEQARFLQAHGCHRLQGFLFGKPGSASEMEGFVRSLPASIAA